MESKDTDYLKDISEIRTMMEKSSRFISLSGLSGVFAGIFAIAGAAFAYYSPALGRYTRFADNVIGVEHPFTEIVMLTLVAMLVLILSLAAGVFFTSRKAKKHGLKTWDATAKRLVINLMLPLMAGGLFCLALIYHGIIGLVAPATLVFYGIALLNGSKYTYNDIRYLGICEIVLGIIASFFPGYGLFFWVVGFGVLHIVYGVSMYYKYDS
jgi:hypothetical protein